MTVNLYPKQCLFDCILVTRARVRKRKVSLSMISVLCESKRHAHRPCLRLQSSERNYHEVKKCSKSSEKGSGGCSRGPRERIKALPNQSLNASHRGLTMIAKRQFKSEGNFTVARLKVQYIFFCVLFDRIVVLHICVCCKC